LALANQLASSSPAEAQALFVSLDKPTQSAILGILTSSASNYQALLNVQNVIVTQGLAIAQSIFGSYSYNLLAGASSSAPVMHYSDSGSHFSNAPNFTVSLNLLATGNSQITALQLSSSFSQVIGGTGGVVLQAQPGTLQVVANSSSGSINVYPPLGLPSATWLQTILNNWSLWYLSWGSSSQAAINAQSAGSPFVLPSGFTQAFYCFSPVQIYAL
jgi:hypothetical protein